LRAVASEAHLRATQENSRRVAITIGINTVLDGSWRFRPAWAVPSTPGAKEPSCAYIESGCGSGHQ